MRQAAVLQAAQTVGPKRSVKAICRAAGVSRARFYVWLRDDAEFRAQWVDIWQVAIRQHLPAVVTAQIHKAQAGNTPAARLVAEMAGVLKHRLEHTGEGGVPLRIILTE